MDLKLYIFRPCYRGSGNYVVMSDSLENAIQVIGQNNNVEFTKDGLQIGDEEYYYYIREKNICDFFEDS